MSREGPLFTHACSIKFLPNTLSAHTSTSRLLVVSLPTTSIHLLHRSSAFSRSFSCGLGSIGSLHLIFHRRSLPYTPSREFDQYPAIATSVIFKTLHQDTELIFGRSSPSLRQNLRLDSHSALLRNECQSQKRNVPLPASTLKPIQAYNF